MKNSVVAIDGPSGVGKSTVAKKVADRLNLPFLDTGKLYRAIGHAAHHAGIDIEQEDALSGFIGPLNLTIRNGSPILDGEDISGRLLSEEAGMRASIISRYSSVRTYLVGIQQAWCRDQGGVLEGRDIGMKVCPWTPHKFYLHASREVRIWRRMIQTGEPWCQTAEVLIRRDHRDHTRKLDPLMLLPDHVPIDTKHLSAGEVVEVIVAVVRASGG